MFLREDDIRGQCWIEFFCQGKQAKGFLEREGIERCFQIEHPEASSRGGDGKAFHSQLQSSLCRARGLLPIIFQMKFRTRRI